MVGIVLNNPQLGNQTAYFYVWESKYLCLLRKALPGGNLL